MKAKSEALPRQSRELPLAGKTILVAGASSGLGAHFARTVGHAGANVVIGARRLALLDAISQQIEQSGAQACALSMDLTDEASIIRAFDEAEKYFGQVDGVIVNAGINIEGSAVLVDDASLRHILDVNVRGTFLTTREAARRMMGYCKLGERHGKIVLISSITAEQVSKGVAIYSATKAAVTQMGRCLAADWAKNGIDVNVVCPGYVKTALNSEWFETEKGERQVARWPRQRLMSEDAFNGIITYLLGEQSNMTTGGVFVIDDAQSTG